MSISYRKAREFGNMTTQDDPVDNISNLKAPDVRLNVQNLFGFAAHNATTLAYSHPTALVPEIDRAYYFDPEVTESILAGFNDNRRVLIHGYHGTGKTSHIEQVAARLNWPVL